MENQHDDILGFSIDDLELDVLGNKIEDTNEDEEEKNEKEKTDAEKEEESEESEEQADDSKTKSKKSEESEDEEEEVNPILVITDHLHEKGIVDKPEDFDGSDDSFEKLFTDKINKGIEEYKSSLNDVSKKFLDYLEAGGDPNKFISVYAERDFSVIKDEDISESEDVEEDEARNSIRREIIKEALKMQGLDDTKIAAKIKKYEDTGILADEAVDALAVLRKVSNERKAQIVEQQKQAAKTKAEALDNWIKTINKTIDNDLDKIVGAEIPKRKKEEFKEFLTKIDPKTKTTALMRKKDEDPDFEIKMAFAAFGGFDLAIKNAERKANTTLADKLKTGNNKGLNINKTDSKGNSLWGEAVKD